MRKQRTYSVLFGRRFCDILLDFAFVTGVVGIILTAIMLFTDVSPEFHTAGWLVSISLLGFSATVAWGAYVTAPQLPVSSSYEM